LTLSSKESQARQCHNEREKKKRKLTTSPPSRPQPPTSPHTPSPSTTPHQDSDPRPS
jgi:hypothetical protein